MTTTRTLRAAALVGAAALLLGMAFRYRAAARPESRTSVSPMPAYRVSENRGFCRIPAPMRVSR